MFLNNLANGYKGATEEQDRINKAKELKATNEAKALEAMNKASALKAKSEAKLAQDNLDNEWRRKEHGFKEQELKLKIDKLEADRKAEGNKNLKTDTYQSLDYLFETGDPIRLNSLLDKYKDNPNMESKFAHIARFDRINKEDLEQGNLANYLRSEKNHDAALEEQLDTNGDGVVDKQDLDGLRKRFVKRITKDGKVEIIDTHTLAGANGYFKNWNPDKKTKNAAKSKDEWRLDEFKSLQAKLKNAKTPEAKQEVQEQIDFLNGGSKGTKPSSNAIKASEIAQAKRDIAELEGKKDLSTKEAQTLGIAQERLRLSKIDKNNTQSKDEWRLKEFKSLQTELQNAKTPNEKRRVQEQIDFLNGGKDGDGYKPTSNQAKAVELANAKKTVEALKDKKDLSTEEVKALDIANERIRLGMTAKGKDNLAEQTAAFDLDKVFKDVPAEEVRKRVNNDKDLKVKFGRLTGFSTQQEKELIKLLPQVQAMKNAAKIDEKETGILDTTIRSIENQFTKVGHKDVETELTASAYQGLMNVIKHALYGSAQTTGEMASFKSAYGSLDGGLVHALAGLRTIVDERLQKLKYIASRKNETFAKYYTGQGSADLDEVITKLDNKLSYLSEFAEYTDTFAKAQGRDVIDKVRGAAGSLVGLVSKDFDKFVSGTTDADVKAARAQLKQAYSDSDFIAKRLELQKKYGLVPNKKPANPLDVEL